MRIERKTQVWANSFDNPTKEAKFIGLNSSCPSASSSGVYLFTQFLSARPLQNDLRTYSMTDLSELLVKKTLRKPVIVNKYRRSQFSPTKQTSCKPLGDQE
jgi:hypothetical protein